MTAGTDNRDRQAAGAAMEGGGFYNRHSAMQAAGISALLPDWEKAVREIALDDGPIVIADYGSSQGRNSMAPIRIAIEEIRARTEASTPIEVVHTDLPTNDFAALFTALADDPASYMAGATNVFPSAIGRSYFEQIFPANSVHLGWNTWALHWLSGEPIYAPDSAIAMSSKMPDVIERLLARQAEDWRRFLSCRARELKTGAKLLTAFAGSIPDVVGRKLLMSEFWQAIQDLGRDGHLSEEERLHITLPIATRSIEDIRAPFAEHGAYAGLRIDKVDILRVLDPAWAVFTEDRDARQFGLRHANAMRAFSGPTIAKVLEARTDKTEMVDKIFARFAARLATAPVANENLLAVVLLSKTET